MRLASRVAPERPFEAPELAFYARVMRTLTRAHVPFLVAGSACLQHHTGLCRDTKDLDLFILERDLDRALGALEQAGLRTELAFPHWLAKAYDGRAFVDLIFNSGNGVTPVDELWFEYASPGMILGESVSFCPIEETIWSKAFVMERERYDGADVAHLLAARARDLDWSRLVWRFGRFWRVLLSHLILFGFIYPDLSREVPPWVMDGLLERLRMERQTVSRRRICLGTLLSREQYLVDLEAGRGDARMPPLGRMQPDDIEAWTAAIRPRDDL